MARDIHSKRESEREREREREKERERGDLGQGRMDTVF